MKRHGWRPEATNGHVRRDALDVVELEWRADGRCVGQAGGDNKRDYRPEADSRHAHGAGATKRSVFALRNARSFDCLSRARHRTKVARGDHLIQRRPGPMPLGRRRCTQACPRGCQIASKRIGVTQKQIGVVHEHVGASDGGVGARCGASRSHAGVSPCATERRRRPRTCRARPHARRRHARRRRCRSRAPRRPHRSVGVQHWRVEAAHGASASHTKRSGMVQRLSE